MDIIGRSLSAAAVIAAIIFMRQVMFKKISKRVLSALWLIAAAKLLLPFGGITFTGTVASDTAVTETAYSSAALEQAYEAAPAISNTVIKVAVPVPVSEDNFFVPYCIWLFVAVFIGAFFIMCHIKSRRTFSCAIPAGYNITPLKNDFGLIRRVRLLVSDRTDTPLTYGIFTPVIILPKSMELHGDSVRNVLCHELAHIKRLDALFKTVIAVCAAVHWFNPLVWVMFVLANRDIELACDETALRCGKAAPEDYAMTLIRVEENRCYPIGGNLHLMGSFAGGKLEERIRGVMTEKKSVLAGFFAAVVSAAVAALNVIVMPYGEVSYVNVYEYSEATTAYDDSATEDIYVGYYSDVIVEQTAYADYPYEEITEADYIFSVTEDVPSVEVCTAVTESNDIVTSIHTNYPHNGNYIIVYEYPGMAHSYITTGKGGVNSDTTVMIKVADDGSKVSKQTAVTPVQSR